MTDSTPATAALPPFCEVHGCRGRWDADQPHTLCGKATTTAASMPKREPSAQWRQVATEVAELFVAFRDEGFTEAQALDLIGAWMKAVATRGEQSGGPS